MKESVRKCLECTKLNYYPSDINWKVFGKEAESLCRNLDLDYYIKDSLRAEMES